MSAFTVKSYSCILSQLLLLLLFVASIASTQSSSNLTASLSLFSSSNVAITISVIPSNNIVKMNFSGPSNVWFGIGFNASDMPNAYSIVCSDTITVQERILGYGSPGTVVNNQEITVESDSIDNGIRRVNIIRSINGSIFSFPTSPNTILPIISAYGTTSYLNKSSDMGDSAKLSMTFLDSNALLYGNNVSGTAHLFMQVSQQMNVTVFTQTKLVEINITGPPDRWFGVGLNGTDMANTYAIICSVNSCQENTLGYGGVGTMISPSLITVMSDTTANGIRKVTIHRKQVVLPCDSLYFNKIFAFPSNAVTVDIISAYGIDDQFDSSSDMENATVTTLPFVNFYNLTGSLSLFADNDCAITIRVNSLTQQVFMNFSGPIGIWFGIGFDGTDMNNTYAIVCDSNGCAEHILGYGSPGVALETVNIVTQTDVTAKGIRRVSISRAMTVESNDCVYDFPSKPKDNVNIITAYGTSDTFDTESDMADAGVLKMAFIDDNHSLNGESNFNGSTVLFGNGASNGNSVNVSVYPSLDLAVIAMTGPSNRWFGVGFDGNDMNNTYAIVCDSGGCYESVLGYGSVGYSVFPQMISVVNDSSDNRVRTVTIHRKQSVFASDSFNFDSVYSFESKSEVIDIIAANGVNNAFNSESGMSNATVSSLTIGTMTGIDLTAKLTMFNGLVFQEITIDVSPKKNSVSMTFVGPSDLWFGIGFDGTDMAGTYGIIASANDTVQERILAYGGPGYALATQNIVILSDETHKKRRTIVISRALKVSASNVYTFPSFASDVNVIYAFGVSSDFNSESSMSSANKSVMSFVSEIPNNGSGSPCDNPETVFYGTSSNVGQGLTVGLYIYCKSNTIQLSIVNSNYAKPNWFGIAFNNAMTPSPNATVYTSGKSEDREHALYSYDLKSKTSGGVQYKPDLNWKRLSENHLNGSISIVYSQNLSVTKWSNSTVKITFCFAHGSSSLKLSQHASSATGGPFTYNLVTGQVLSSSDDTIRIIHGCTMFIAWSLLCTVGIFSSAFRTVIYIGAKSKATWFFVHRGVQITAVMMALIGFAIAVYFTQHYGNPHFSDTHEICGLIVTCLGLMQPINAWFRCHPAKPGHARGKGRLLWECVHKPLGYGCWALSHYTIYLGIDELTNDTIYFTIFEIWCVVICLSFVLLLFARFKIEKFQSKHESDNHNKSLLDSGGSDGSDASNISNQSANMQSVLGAPNEQNDQGILSPNNNQNITNNTSFGYQSD